MKTIMFLSKPFITDPRVYKEAKSLSEHGHEVTVIFWDRHTEYNADEMIENIRVIGIKNNIFMRVLPYVMLRNPLWCINAYKRAMRLYKDEYRFDVVHCHDLDTLLIGYLLKRKLGVKLIYDAHEIYGYMIEKSMPKFFSKLAFILEEQLIKKVDSIITVNEPLVDYFSKIMGKDINIVMNCSELITDKYSPPKTSMFTVSYFGVLNQSRMFPDIIDYFGLFNNIRFVIGGKKEDMYFAVKQASKKYSNIMFLGTITSAQVIERTFDCDVVLCMLDPSNKNNQVGLPNKIFEAMLTGRPVIVTRGLYCSELVEQEKCGVTIDYDFNAVVGAVHALRDHKEQCQQLGRNGLNSAIREYNWGKQEAVLLHVYERLQE